MISGGQTKHIIIDFRVRSAGHKELDRTMKKLGKSTKGATDAQQRFRVMTTGQRRIIGAVRNEILILIFALGGLGRAISNTIKNANKMESAFKGLASVARNMGVAVQGASKVAQNLAKTGLLTVTEASAGLKNLLATGIGLEKATDMMWAFTDAASFNRQGMLSLGEALVGATEGYKNMLSMKVDNIGITKNLSLMEKDYARTIGKTVGVLTEMERRTAHYVGIMKEARIFTGDHIKVMGTLSGQFSKLGTSIFNMSASIGRGLQPAMTILVKSLGRTIKAIEEWFKINEEKLSKGLVDIAEKTLFVRDAFMSLFAPLAKLTFLFIGFNSRLVLISISLLAVSTAIVLLRKAMILIGGAKILLVLFAEYVIIMRSAYTVTHMLKLRLLALLSIPFVKLVIVFTALSFIYAKITSHMKKAKELQIKQIQTTLKENEILLEKITLKRDEYDTDLRLIQGKIELEGRTEKLIARENIAIQQVYEKIRAVKELQLTQAKLVLEEKRIKAERELREFLPRERGFGFAMGEILPTADIVKELPANIDEIVKIFKEGQIKLRLQRRGISDEGIEKALEYRTAVQKVIDIEKELIDLKAPEIAKLRVEIKEKEVETLKKLILTMERNIKLEGTYSKEKQETLKLQFAYEDRLTSISKLEHAGNELKKEGFRLAELEKRAAFDKIEYLKKIEGLEEKREARMGLVDLRREIDILKAGSEQEKEKISLLHEEIALVTKLLPLAGRDVVLRDQINDTIREYIRLRKEQRDEDVDPFLEKLMEAGKISRRVAALATAIGGVTAEKLRVLAAQRVAAVIEEMEFVRLTENEKLSFGIKTEEDLAAFRIQIREDLGMRLYELELARLDKEISLQAKVKAEILKIHQHTARIMENISTALFDSEIRRQLTLKKIVGSMAYETLAISLDVLRKLAIQKAAFYMAEFVASGFTAGHKLAAAAGMGAVSGGLAAAAGEARGRAAEHLEVPIGGVGDITETAGGGTRKYGATTQLPAQNITISPSVILNTSGGSIIVSSGGAEVLEREIAEMTVKAIETAIRSQEIDLIGVGSRR